jgi:Ca2+-binding RTX toxin-like protein
MALVVFAGQSNAGGAYMAPETLTQPWTPDPHILIWNPEAKAWEELQPGVNTGYGDMPKAWAAEVEFAREFHAQYPDETLYIVKSVEGGRSLHMDTGAWVYDWSPQSPDELFDRTTGWIDDARASLGGAKVDAVFWGQGETDATNADWAAEYRSNLEALFAAIREQWMHDPAGRIGLYDIGTTSVYADPVRAAEQAVDAEDDNALAYDTAGLPLLSDGLHFAAVTHDSVGHNYFDMYLAWREGTAYAPSSPPGPPGGLVLQAKDGGDTLYGAAGDDQIDGGDGQDYLRGAEGRDTIRGGAAFDDINGNQGDDIGYGGDGDDWVVGGKDQDVLFGEAGGDIVYGNLGNDTADGGDGADLIRGGQGDDLLTGGTGDDWISGDRGDDTMSGGWGADVFHSFAEAGIDRVTDFDYAGGDRVRLDPGTSYSVVQDGSDVVIDMGPGAQMVLAGVSLSSLGDGWISVG